MKYLAGLVIIFIVSGCTAFKLQEPSTVNVGGAYTVELANAWSSRTDGHIQLLTQDGPALQMVMISSGVKDKGHLFSGMEGASQPPYKKSLSLLEVKDFIHDSLVAINAENVEIIDFRPATFGNWPGFRAELSFVTKNGLDKKGIISGAQKNDKLYTITYMAPAIYYFDKNKGDVERIIQSVKTAQEF